MKSITEPASLLWRWLWIIQIAVGIICIALSISIFLAPRLGLYSLLLLATLGLLILGCERIAAGILSKNNRRTSRLINVGIGVAIVAYLIPGFFYPEFITKLFVLFLGFGLLANGIVRIISGLKESRGESLNILPFGAGILSTAIGLVVLVFPSVVGVGLLLIMTGVALAVSGVQIILVAVRGRRGQLQQNAFDSSYRLSSSSYSTSHGNQQPQRHISSNGIWKRGTWFSDDQGRYLLFRGVNFASRSKLPPYLPIAPLEVKTTTLLDLRKEIESVKGQLDLLKDLGFNVVRLLISWKAIEPRPNSNLEELLPEGKQYLNCMKEIIDQLHARNISVILDFHQDIAHEVYDGDGFPDWALAIDEEHIRPEPSNMKNKKWQIKYVLDKSVKNTLQSFWQNNLTNKEKGLENFPVRTHLEKTIGQTARFFQSESGQIHPAILGIEPFNEPHPVGLPKEKFEKEILVEYYRNVNAEITCLAPGLFVFLEPRVDWTVSKASSDKSLLGQSPFSAKSTFHLSLVKDLVVEGRLDSKQIHTYLPQHLHQISTFGLNGVLSFHYYDTVATASSFVNIPGSLYTYRREWPHIFDQLVSAATKRELIPFLTEFGGYQGTEQAREYLNLQFEQIEAHILNATCWNYDLYHTIEGKDNWNLEDYSLLGPNRTPRNIDVVARPYPMRSSAEPVLLSFDIDSKNTMIVLRGTVVDAPTIIFIPFNIHYAPEFTVWATGYKVTWDKKNQLLYWYPSKENENNQIIIGKQRTLDANLLPQPRMNFSDKIALMGTFS